MKHIMLALLLVGMAGCSTPVKVVTQSSGDVRIATSQESIGPEAHDPTDEEKIDLLRTEAKNRGLQWEIICTKKYTDDPEDFLAFAYWPGSDDDEHDRWIQDGNNQADAAYALFESIQGPATHPADKNKKKEKERALTICPPPISFTTSPGHVREILRDTKTMRTMNGMAGR